MNDLKPDIKAKVLREFSQTPRFSKDISDSLAIKQYQEQMASTYAYVLSLEPHATEKFLLELFSLRRPFGEGDNWVRGHALTLLLRLPHIDPYAVLDDVFLQRDRYWRAVACRHVQEQYELRPSPVALNMLLRALRHDESAHVRACAAITLREIGATEALPALREALNDEGEDESGVGSVSDYAQEAIEAILLRESDI